MAETFFTKAHVFTYKLDQTHSNKTNYICFFCVSVLAKHAPDQDVFGSVWILFIDLGMHSRTAYALRKLTTWKSILV